MQISPEGTCTARFNRRHKLFGHLFSGRYKSLVVDAASPGYLRTVCEYVHLNPVRAKWLRLEEPLRGYRWSSRPAYLERPERRAPWLRVERVLAEMGIPKDSAAGRQQFERVMEERRALDQPEEYGRVRRGWCWGEEAVELLAQVEERRGASHYGAEFPVVVVPGWRFGLLAPGLLLETVVRRIRRQMTIALLRTGCPG